MCKVATTQDMSAGMQLSESPGWMTLIAILDSSGERPQKRAWSMDTDDVPDRSRSPGTQSEQLAKRLKGASLK